MHIRLLREMWLNCVLNLCFGVHDCGWEQLHRSVFYVLVFKDWKTLMSHVFSIIQELQRHPWFPAATGQFVAVWVKLSPSLFLCAYWQLAGAVRVAMLVEERPLDKAVRTQWVLQWWEQWQLEARCGLESHLFFLHLHPRPSANWHETLKGW